MTLAQLLANRPCVLLDFDGPVCAVFGGAESAPDAARTLAGYMQRRGVSLHNQAAETGDPFDILRGAEPHDAEAVERALREVEIRAVATAPMTSGLREVLGALLSSGHTVTIVSNNSEAAVDAFVTAHGLHEYLCGIVGRTAADPTLLKPHPHLVRQAISERGTVPEACVLVGDSTTDVEAARRAGTAAIAYANKPGKREAFEPLMPDAIISALQEIQTAVSADLAL